MFYVSKELQSVRSNALWRNHTFRFLRRSLNVSNGNRPDPIGMQLVAANIQRVETLKLLAHSQDHDDISDPADAVNHTKDLYSPDDLISKELAAYLQLSSLCKSDDNKKYEVKPQIPRDWSYYENLIDFHDDKVQHKTQFEPRRRQLAVIQSDDAKGDVTLNLSETSHDLKSKEYTFEPEIPMILGLDKNYDIISCIGFGAHGCVFKVRHKWDKKFYALKTICVSDKNLERVTREVEAMACLSSMKHENIVTYHSSWIVNQMTNDTHFDSADSCSSFDSLSGEECVEEGETMPRALRASTYGKGRTLIIKMELCVVENVGSFTLRHWLNQRKYLDRSESVHILNDVISGLMCVHNHGYIHRDIKPENILIATNKHGILRAKICDFGLVSNIDTEHTETRTEHSSTPNELTSGVGTMTYSAPEQLDSSIYSKPCDIFSLGVLIFELFHERFRTGMERVQVLNELRNGKVLFNNTNPDVNLNERNRSIMIALVRSCVDRQPLNRPSLEGIKLTLALL